MSWEVIDVSKFQTITDYTAAANSVNGVLIRVGYRGYGSSGTLVVDPKFNSHYNGFSGKTKVGIYWFTNAISTAEARAEADFVYRQIKDKRIDFPVYLDSEIADVNNHSGRADSLGASERTTYAIAFMDRMIELGYRAGIYASDAWFRGNLQLSRLENKQYSLWVAKYSSSSPKYVSNYDGWQYTSDAYINGISGRVDKSHFYNDVAGWNGSVKRDINDYELNVPWPLFYYDFGKQIWCSFTLGNLQWLTDFYFSCTDNVYPGTVTCTIVGMGNYTGSRTFDYYIIPRDVNTLSISLAFTSATYTGSEIRPGVTVKSEDGSYTLTEGVEYSLSYSNNVNAGQASVTITGIGQNFNQSVTKTFTINPMNLSNAGQIKLPQEEYEYTGSSIEPTISIGSLVAGRDFVCSYINNVNIGIATAKATGIGNYTSSLIKYFEIIKPKIPITTKNASISYTSTIYNGKAQCPTVTVEDLVENRDYKVVVKDNINAGVATILINGINEYSGTITKTFVIKPEQLDNCAASIPAATYTYNRSPIVPAVTITNGSIKLVEKTDYTLVYSNNVNVGAATISITAKGNYEGSKTLSFNIIPKDISNDNSFKLSQTLYDYNGMTQKPEVTNTGGYALNRDYTVKYPSDVVNAGTKVITITGVNNYTGSFDLTYKIQPISLVNFTAHFVDDPSTLYYYTSGPIEPKVTVDKLEYKTDYEVEYFNNIEIGKATVNINGVNNYTGFITLYFDIYARSLKNTIAKYGVASVKTIYRIEQPDSELEVYPDESKSERFVEGVDYKILETDRYESTDFIIASFTVKGLGSLYDEVVYRFRIILSEPTKPIDLHDDGVYNYGDIDDSDMTADGDYNFGDLDGEPQDSRDPSEPAPMYVKKIITAAAFQAMFDNIEPEPEEKVKDGEDYDFDAMSTMYLANYDEDNGFNIDYKGNEEKEDPVVDPDPDEGVYNFGDIDDGDETAVGDYDFGDLDEGVDDDTVAIGDYDFNVMDGDSEEWLAPGTEFILDDTPIYNTYSIPKSFDTRSGKYYVYNGDVKNKRVRLCKLEVNVDEPAKSAGWFNTIDLLNLGKIVVNDQVLVEGILKEFANGNGGNIDKNGQILYVKEILDPEEYPYNYALSNAFQSARVGFASEEMLTRIKPD